ncbi:hypothetical protein GGR51DRAFT_563970 [Nemania sp. FL0031]|nr:hypothetical protein GGR51DRAFT_563970 [Nemania sp. FL0031]
MPRKVRLPADPAQNRVNQQRSRARRKEYVEALEARVHEFEHREVQATLEMQRAAREVAWVNERLMELLAARGVSREEVDEFLRRRGGGRDEEITVAVRRCVRGVRRNGGSLDEGAPAEGVRNGEQNTDGRDAGAVTITGTDMDMSIGNSGRGVNAEDINVCDGVSGTPRRITVADEGSRALVTSCDDAASIIADFQGHGDVSHARKALGCGDATKCHVKNTRLFQLMDEGGCH